MANLFEAVERWEASVGADHNEAENAVKAMADRLAADSPSSPDRWALGRSGMASFLVT